MDEQKVTEEKIEDGGNIPVPGFLLNALSSIPFHPHPEPASSSWQVEELTAEMEDGSTKKMFFVVETRISGNEIRVYWYNLPDLQNHVRTAMAVLQKLTMMEQVGKPNLLIANKQQMNNVIEEAKQTGLIHLGN